MERYAVTKGREWVGVYSFQAEFREKGAASADISLLHSYRGEGLEEALLAHALERTRELGCPHLLIEVNEENEPLLAACKRLDFEFLHLMEGMYRRL